MNFLSPPSFLTDMLGSNAQYAWYGVLGLGALLVLIVLLAIVGKLFGKKKGFKEDTSLNENLADFPPPPKAGPRKLLVQGSNARVRLVVIAPVGKAAQLDSGKAEALLEHVVRGLGAVAGQDKPRIKVWPAQLSHEGFAETFLRVVKSPDKEGKASKWVLVAGRAKVGEKYILLGLGLQADEAVNLGKLRPKPDQWNEMLHIKT